MSLPSLVRKVLLIDLIKGLRVTFNYQKPSEAITERYFRYAHAIPNPFPVSKPHRRKTAWWAAGDSA